MTASDIRSAAVDELNRRELAEGGKKPKSLKPGVEVGGTGLEVFGGIISGEISEHNTDWDGEKRYKIVDRMRRGDATCAATLLAITLPIISTEVHIEARKGPKDAAPDPIVEEAAEFIHEALFGDTMQTSWESWAREAALCFAYGHYLFEKVYAPIEQGEFQGAMGWSSFAPRHPRTVSEWKFDKNNRLIGIEQQFINAASGSQETKDIDVAKMLVCTHDSEAGNPMGTSVLRPAWKHWKYKDGFYAVQAIAIERQGAGTPFAQYPQGTGDPDIDKAEEMLQNFQAHEQSYVTYAEDWNVGFLDMGSGSVLDPSKAIEHHDSMISKSILAGFLGLPQDGKGSYALSEDQSGFFQYSLQHAANNLASIINRQGIPDLLRVNYPDLPTYPRLRFDRIGSVSLGKLLEGLSSLARDGVLTTDLGLENRVRELYNLPTIDEADFEAEAEPEPDSGVSGTAPVEGKSKQE